MRAAQATLSILLLFSTRLVLGQNTPAPQPGAAQPPDAEHNVTDLAKQTQNPVGDVVSVPFQFNFNSGGAFKDQTFFNLNFQPVIPIHLTPRWTFIARTIVPIDSIPTSSTTSSSGVGDIQEQTFFTPARPGKLIWGIGPDFSFPTATASPAKTGTWGGGGSAVLLATPGPFVLGSLFTQLSPMHDTNGKPKLNAFLWQYFVNYNFGKGIGTRHCSKHHCGLDRRRRTEVDHTRRRRHQPNPRLQQAANDSGLPVLLQREATRHSSCNDGPFHNRSHLSAEARPAPSLSANDITNRSYPFAVASSA